MTLVYEAMVGRDKWIGIFSSLENAQRHCEDHCIALAGTVNWEQMTTEPNIWACSVGIPEKSGGVMQLSQNIFIWERELDNPLHGIGERNA